MRRRTFFSGALAEAVASGCSTVSEPPRSSQVKPGDIPKREFGKTGEKLTIVGPGAARFRMITWEEATAVTQRAYDLGINYFDNSHNYWDGRSEEVYGAVLKPFRKELFITTKVDARTREGAEKELEASLKSLQTDYVDLWQLHKVGHFDDDLDAIFAPGGAMEALVAAQQTGKCRFIGFTVHGDPNVVLRMLELHDGWDATLVSLNPADPSYLSFEKIALPALVESGIGIQVMKSLGNGKLVPTIAVRECLHYSLSLPTHCIAVGVTTIGQLEDDVRFAQQFKTLSAATMDDLRARGARAGGPATENWKKEYPQQAALAGHTLHDDV